MEQGTLLQHVSGEGPLYVFVKASDDGLMYYLTNTETGQITTWDPSFFEEAHFPAPGFVVPEKVEAKRS